MIQGGTGKHFSLLWLLTANVVGNLKMTQEEVVSKSLKHAGDCVYYRLSVGCWDVIPQRQGCGVSTVSLYQLNRSTHWRPIL